MRFFFTTTWKWLQVAPRVLEMFAGTRRHPRTIFTLLEKLPAGLLYKTAEDIWPRKIKTKVDFFQASGTLRPFCYLAMLLSARAVWPTPAPFKTLKRSLSHFFQPAMLTCSRKRVSQLTMTVPLNHQCPPEPE